MNFLALKQILETYKSSAMFTCFANRSNSIPGLVTTYNQGLFQFVYCLYSLTQQLSGIYQKWI